MDMNCTFMNEPDPDRIMKALAEAYQCKLERETGRKITVTVFRKDDDGEDEDLHPASAEGI